MQYKNYLERLNLERLVKPTSGMAPADTKSYTVVSIQTSSDNLWAYGNILAIAAYKVEKCEFKESFYAVINPHYPVAEGRLKKHTNLTQDDLDKGRSLHDVLQRFREFVDDSILVMVNEEKTFDFLIEFSERCASFLTCPYVVLDDSFALMYNEKRGWKYMSQTLGIRVVGDIKDVRTQAHALARCLIEILKSGDVGITTCKTKKQLPVYPHPSTEIAEIKQWAKGDEKRIYVTLKDDDLWGQIYYDFNKKEFVNLNWITNLDWRKVKLLIQDTLKGNQIST